jgi:hypothetical protein
VRDRSAGDGALGPVTFSLLATPRDARLNREGPRRDRHEATEDQTSEELDNNQPSQEIESRSWDALTQLLAECAIDTGISDLAHQHDHYLYGSPKRPTDAEVSGWQDNAKV